MKNFILFIKKHKIIIFIISVFFFYNVFPDIFKEKTVRTYLGARIFVLSQDLTPEEARILVIDESRKNPLLTEYSDIMNYEDRVVWTRMFVCEDEYFFPLHWPKEAMREEGYYVNPKTRKIRYVNNDFYFYFPFFHDRTSIKVYQ